MNKTANRAATLLLAPLALSACAGVQPTADQRPSASAKPSLAQSTSEAGTTAASSQASSPVASTDATQSSAPSQGGDTSPAPGTMVQPTCTRPGRGGTVTPTTQAFTAPGENHVAEAEAYTYKASDVQAWIRGTKPQPAKKVAFLTFDDGPSGLTPAVLDTLKAKGVHATFFVIASQVDDAKAAILQREAAEGHAVAIHTFSHDYGYLYPGRRASAQHIACDLDWGIFTLQKALGPQYATSSYRNPGGHMSWKGMKASDSVEQAKGRYWLDWNAMTGDADAELPHATAAQLAANVPKTIAMNPSNQRNVVVILMHDFFSNHKGAQALPAVIDGLRKQGFQFGIVD